MALKPRLMIEPHTLSAAHIGREACGLSRPVFNPTQPSVVACATQPTAAKNENLKVFVMQFESGAAPGVHLLCESPVPEPVLDLQWLTSTSLLVAVGAHLRVIQFNREGRPLDNVIVPNFHTNDIRSINIHPTSRNLLVSGGYDGKLFLTDLEQMFVLLRRGAATCNNVLYNAGTSVSSVQWRPESARQSAVSTSCMSCTTDAGAYHLVDTRAASQDQVTFKDTARLGLYAHAYLDPVTLLLGFGDGSLLVFDIRNMSDSLVSFRDTFASQIGDIVVDNSTFATFGEPAVSLWNYDLPKQEICLRWRGCWCCDVTPCRERQVWDEAWTKSPVTTSGDISRDGTTLAMTDSVGRLHIYNVEQA